MEEKLRILVVGGHPADVFDHCGGTLAHHVKNGDRVTCLALTQGLRIRWGIAIPSGALYYAAKHYANRGDTLDFELGQRDERWV